MNRSAILVYALSCFAFLVSISFTPYSGSLLVKALPILILVGVAHRTLRGSTRLIMVAALVFSAGGDVLLELGLFTPGLASFLVAQLCYARHFFSQRDTSSLPYGRLLIMLALMSVASFPVILNAGELLVPVAIYMTAIGLMAIGAAVYRQPSTVLFLGALLFVASDSMIGINRFVTPFGAANYAIMISYYAAQVLILWGVLASQGRDGVTLVKGTR
jgi:uncharacterized membrane protein YhhN